MFSSLIDSTAGLTLETAVICTAVSILLGLVACFVYRLNNKHASKSLMMTLCILPALVQAVIMLVNGSIGAGIAVMGAFNLVRFRSNPGSARDICFIFYVMGIGLATGMGYLGFAALLTVIVGVVLGVFSFIPAFSSRKDAKLLRVLIPEDMDYTDCFKDIFDEYLSSVTMLRAKTTNMGMLYELKYDVVLKDASKEKEMLDKIRTRNGNLMVSCEVLPVDREEL
ncbi:MAG: DUF4956 domain-containing protein [Oscillospiraceae bacterium]